MGEDARAAAGDRVSSAAAGDPAEELRSLRAEVAQLRYELSRLRDRRTVRAALALGAAASDGPRQAWHALTGRAPRLDVPGPPHPPLRPPFPQLRVISTGPGTLVAGACSHGTITPADGVAVIGRDRPDLLVVDGLAGWSAADLAEVVDAVRAHGAAVVTASPSARAAVPKAALHVVRPGDQSAAGAEAAPGARAGGADCVLAVPGVVDLRAASPAGLDPAPAHRVDDARTLTLAGARRQPVVVLPTGSEIGIDRCLALMAAGAVVVAGDDRALAAALSELDPATRGLVLGAAGEDPPDLEARAQRLLADDDLRARVSVRLRRQVQTHRSAAAALEGIVAALELLPSPPRRISVLLATRRPDRLGQVLDDLAAQRHDDLEVVLLPHGDLPLPADLPLEHVRVQRVPAERPLGAVLDAGLDLVSGAYVAKIDDDDRYGPHHLGDLLGALAVSGADIVGRRCHGVYLEGQDATVHPGSGSEERYENHLPGGSLLLPATVLRERRWRHVPNAVDTELIRSIHLAGGSAYTSHRYGYVRVRHADHTWAAPDGWDGTVTTGFDDTLLEA